MKTKKLLLVSFVVGLVAICMANSTKTGGKIDWMPRAININQIIGTNRVERIPNNVRGEPMGYKYIGEPRWITIGLREDGVVVWKQGINRAK